MSENNSAVEHKAPKESRAVVRHQKKELDNAFSKLPQTFEGAKEYCEYLASSQIVPKQFQGKPNDIFVAVSWGQNIGLGVMPSLNSIGVINGSPGLYGPGYIGLINGHPDNEFTLFGPQAYAYAKNNVDGYEWLADVKNEGTVTVVVSKRKSKPFPAVSTFTDEDLKKSGLGGRDTYKRYEPRMRKYRAFHDLAKDYWSDVTHGIGMYELMEEEQGDNTQQQAKAPQNGESDSNSELSDAVMAGMGVEDQEEEIPEAEIIEDSEDDQEEPEKQDDPEEEDVERIGPRSQKEILDTAKYLPKKKSSELAKEISKEGFLTTKRADYWRKEIREAHTMAKRSKDKES